MKQCVGCGIEFVPPFKKRKVQRYCSVRCATLNGPWAYPVNKKPATPKTVVR